MGLRRGILGAAVAVTLCASAVPAAPAAAVRGPLTTFEAKRDGLLIRIGVVRHQIRFTELRADVVCPGAEPKPGYANINEYGTFGFGIKRSGHFEHKEFHTFPTSTIFWRLEGQIHHNRVAGRYTAWEEGFKDGESQPQCGTRSPRGLPISFVARRVSGPPWRG